MQKQVVKFGGEAVGALVPDQGQFRFLAVKFNVWPLDGRIFADHREAIGAVQVLLSGNANPVPAATFWVPVETEDAYFGWNEYSSLPLTEATRTA